MSLIEAYVVHSRPYRETSVITDFFTRTQGRVSGVVRGVRKAKSEKKSLIQSFQCLQVQFSGKSDLKTVTHIERSNSEAMLTGETLYCGLYLNELLARVLPQGVEIEPVFTAYQQALAALPSTEFKDVALRQFEFALLHELGVLPDLTVDVDTGEELIAGNIYGLQADLGLSQQTINKPVFRGEDLIAMHEGNWNTQSRHCAKQLSRQLLIPLLGPKPLQSRALFRS